MSCLRRSSTPDSERSCAPLSTRYEPSAALGWYSNPTCQSVSVCPIIPYVEAPRWFAEPIVRFTTAMDGVADRASYPHVEVDVGRVRASGLAVWSSNESGFVSPVARHFPTHSQLAAFAQVLTDYPNGPTSGVG